MGLLGTGNAKAETGLDHRSARADSRVHRSNRCYKTNTYHTPIITLAYLHHAEGHD